VKERYESAHISSPSGIASRCAISGSTPISTSSQADLAAGTALMTHLSNTGSMPAAEDLRKRKQLKNQFAAVVEVFNKPEMKGAKESMEMLYKFGLVPQGDAVQLARFFRFTPGLSRANVGEWLGKRDDFHISVLKEYVKLFDCRGMAFDAALRAFLESFRIPGEAQIISRILEIWAAHYYAANPGPFAAVGKNHQRGTRGRDFSLLYFVLLSSCSSFSCSSSSCSSSSCSSSSASSKMFHMFWRTLR
jgi:Sec7-like guanine-nucleotide exchange factor